MYKEHPQLKNSEGNCKIWKYMNISKFLNLLNGTMYFNNVGNFEDVFEATYPVYNQVNRKSIYGEDQVIPENLYKEIQKICRETMFVSCFHKSEYETAFMWNQYAGNEGIAIVSSIDRLKKCFCGTEEDIYICDVTYIDYLKDFLPEGNAMYLALYKRKSFSFENEVRCLFSDNKVNPKYKGKCGILFPVDLDLLIDKIYISPYAPKYLRDDLQRLINTYGLYKEVIYSPLYIME